MFNENLPVTRLKNKSFSVDFGHVTSIATRDGKFKTILPDVRIKRSPIFLQFCSKVVKLAFSLCCHLPFKIVQKSPDISVAFEIKLFAKIFKTAQSGHTVGYSKNVLYYTSLHRFFGENI